jgi:hypothetical protein
MPEACSAARGSRPTPRISATALELGTHIDHVEIGVLPGFPPDRDQLEQLGVDPDHVLGEREEKSSWNPSNACISSSQN